VGASDDKALAIAVDNGGNVFVAGESTGTSSGFDYVTVAYSNQGQPLWTNRYNGPGNSSDYPYAMTVSDGNVIVTGSSTGTGSGFDYATVAYSNTGMPLWTNRYNGPGNGSDFARAVAVDSNGNVFVTGYSAGGVGPTSYDFATVAYSRSGAPLWTNRYNGPADNHDEAYAIAVGLNGNVFVTGASSGDGTGVDYATIAYSNVGLPLWTNRYNATGNGNDVAGAIAVDSSGNVFVTGTSTGDYATVAYSSEGLPLWTNRYNGTANDQDQGSAIAVDEMGNVIVTGFSAGSGSYPDYFDYATIAYSNAGLPLWTNRYNGSANGDDEPHAMAVDGSGNVFVAGASVGTGSGMDYVTIKYASSIPPVHLTIERDGSGGLFVRYTGVPGITYRLQQASGVAGPWSGIATNSPPPSGLIEYHEVSPPPGQAFYRTVQP